MPTNQSTRRRRTLAPVAAVAVVAVAALALGACGGGGADGSAAAKASTTSTTSPSGADASSDGGNAVAIKDFAFSPDGLHIKAGTKVTFTNHDGFDHTVTAKDGSFDSGHLANDASFDHTFDAPGTYPYLCSIHNSMTGSVVVS